MPSKINTTNTTESIAETTQTQDESSTVWYLAYGSNMDPKVLTGRRKIKPIESKVVTVPGYWLSFDIRGIPYLEPCFASILKMDPSRLHDKAYALEVHSRTQHGREFMWDETHPEHPQRSYPPVLQGVAHRITLQDWQRVIQTEVNCTDDTKHIVKWAWGTDPFQCGLSNLTNPPLLSRSFLFKLTIGRLGS